MRFIAQLLLPFMRSEIADVQPLRQPSTEKAPKAKPPRRTQRRRATPRQVAYDGLVDAMKAEYGFRVRKWRRSMSGCAWELLYTDGRRQLMLEAPYPKSPLSCSIFLHEVGHHAIGLGAVRPRCLEELRAWQWSLAAMEARGLEIDDKVRDRFRRSMEYAVAKAVRRGVRALPEELARFHVPSA
ncbi:MAG: hypothetical protein SGJ09_17100 [Phycisphaerae bacterium]|nr:hypothetical protein [Phycisphaerae bacterium]